MGIAPQGGIGGGFPPRRGVGDCGLLIAVAGSCRCSLTLIAVPDCCRCSLPWRPGAPAFWSAAAGTAGGPASPHRRGRAKVTGRAATAPMVRRRPASLLEQLHRDCVPRGLPGIGIVRSAEGRQQGIAGTMPCPARPSERQYPACSQGERDGRSCGLSGLVENPAPAPATAAPPPPRCTRWSTPCRRGPRWSPRRKASS